MSKQKQNAAAYRAKMGADHELKNVWIPKPDITKLETLAQAKGWLANTGRNAGQVNFQQAIIEVLQAGLKSLQA